MEVTPLIAPERQLIQAYRPGGFRITGLEHTGSVLVFPDRTLPWRHGPEPDLESLQAVLTAEPTVEILVLGMGARFALPPKALRAAFRERRIAVEAMATPAGCRTYNVLMAEDRRVAAALVAMPETG
jgi:uncharacterized protein